MLIRFFFPSHSFARSFFEIQVDVSVKGARGYGGGEDDDDEEGDAAALACEERELGVRFPESCQGSR